MRKRFFRFLSRLIANKHGWIVACSVIFTLLMLAASFKLKMKTRISDMLPEQIPQAREFDRVVNDYSSVSTVMITIEDTEKNLRKMTGKAEELAEQLKGLTLPVPREGLDLSLFQRIAIWRGKKDVPGVVYDTLSLVKRIDYKADHDFIARHGLMAQKNEDLENFVDMYYHLSLPELLENINDNFEKEYIADTEKLNEINGEEEAVQGLEMIKRFLMNLDRFEGTPDSVLAVKASEELIMGQKYFISSDNTMLLMMLQPTVSMNDFELALDLAYRIEDVITSARERSPDLEIGRTGIIMLQMDENEALKKDFGWPSLFAVLIILFLLIVSFKSYKKPLYSIITLVLGIIWVSGILALTIEYLTAMSAAFGLILIGLGIDFGIHYISGFNEGKEKKLTPEECLAFMYQKVGSGVVTGGTTTAMVFFSLYFTGFKAFAQMGLAIGLGILVVLFAMMALLPAFMVREETGRTLYARFLKKMNKNERLRSLEKWKYSLTMVMNLVSPRFDFLFSLGKILGRTRNSVIALIAALLLAGVSFYFSGKIGFQYDMMELEPRGINSVITQKKILDKFEMAPDFALLEASSLSQCRNFVEDYKKMGNRTGLIGKIDAISELIPPGSVQEKNKALIKGFTKSLSKKKVPIRFTREDLEKYKRELERLHDNIVEIGELSITSKGLKNKIIRKCDQIVGKKDENSMVLKYKTSLDENSLPALEKFQRIAAGVIKEKLIEMSSLEKITLDNIPGNIRKRYVNPKNDNLLITIYPKNNIWEQRTLERFVEKGTEISKKMTGTPVITLIFIELTKEKGRLAVMIGLAAIFFLLLIDFRSVRYSLMAMVPLMFGFYLMLGVMYSIGLKFDYSNFMSLPLILGIGIDDGVHVLHRYREEGGGNMPRVIHHTGRAILLTSLTTMIGFGSMGLASHRGIAGMGILLFVGVGTCFISSAFILPAIIQVLEKWFHLNPKGGLK